ncbi:hypothetical protein FisN_8Lu241 [Fistulifera solaris]|uniref:Glycosyltransferase family 92 protein n=1 Tax=Fistulifera solaris TaxID=1519565 RepID=A0A1Z5JNC0_FISSO|nr:hypothetical protein FisN_8Lu241 [Fistulifera solaris]|eukprot:GAX15507.1 hypothetical protein FisN_8Lu241 [Fistulifera solaris]
MIQSNIQIERKDSFQNANDSPLSFRFLRTASKYCVVCCVLVSAVFTILNILQSIQYKRSDNDFTGATGKHPVITRKPAHLQRRQTLERQVVYGNTMEERLANATFARDEHPEDISIAICYKTMFGSFSLNKALLWMEYYRALGVDHFFFWYLSDWPVTQSAAWADFIALSYVTVSLYTGHIKANSTRGTHYGQNQVEKECLRDHAQDFTWALPLDVDEYLWLSRNQTLKQFLWEHQDYNSISLGKFMHTFDHQVPLSLNELPRSTRVPIRDPQSGLFGLEVYSYTAGSFCTSAKGLPPCPPNQCFPGGTQCPSWKGRSKVLVRPQIHHEVYQHGFLNPLYKPHALRNKGALLIPTTQGHWKEWKDFFSPRPVPAVMHQDRLSFSAPDNFDFHNFPQAYAKNDEGFVTLFHDEHWAPWLHYVDGLHGISVQEE